MAVDGRDMEESLVRVPGGTATLGSLAFHPGEWPVVEVEVAELRFDRHPVTNAQFGRFVAETGHVTVPETSPTLADFPDADPALLVPGSQVFTQCPGPVPLSDCSAPARSAGSSGRGEHARRECRASRSGPRRPLPAMANQAARRPRLAGPDGLMGAERLNQGSFDCVGQCKRRPPTKRAKSCADPDCP